MSLMSLLSLSMGGGIGGNGSARVLWACWARQQWAAVAVRESPVSGGGICCVVFVKGSARDMEGRWAARHGRPAIFAAMFSAICFYLAENACRPVDQCMLAKVTAGEGHRRRAGQGRDIRDISDIPGCSAR